MLSRLLFLYIALCLFSTPLTASASVVSFSEAKAFLAEMKSETILLPGRSPLFNHYYRSEKILPTAVVFLPGMGESSLKYYDLGRDLRHIPATLYMWDHIGQGFSSHLIPEERGKVYIDSFDTHVAALKNFLAVLHKTHKEVLVIAHSMGGHLALRVALEQPGLIQKLAMTSPMTDLNYEAMPIRHLTWLLDYLPGKSYPPLYFLFLHSKKKGGNVTQSEERVDVLSEIFANYPDVKREGTTIGWLREALRSIKKLKQLDPKNASVPILIVQAEKDFLVSTQDQSEWCKKLPHCRSQVIPHSLHELFFEKDPERQLTLDSVVDFLQIKPMTKN